jgi:hypothetical protein
LALSLPSCLAPFQSSKQYERLAAFFFWKASKVRTDIGPTPFRVVPGCAQCRIDALSEKWMTETGFNFEAGGLNSYPDFRLVAFKGGFEVKELAYPGREATARLTTPLPAGTIRHCENRNQVTLAVVAPIETHGGLPNTERINLK